MSNHRPISLLPQVSRILEKIFAKRLNSFLTKYGVISNSQYGFKASTSIRHASAADASNYIASTLHKGYFTMAIFIDLRHGRLFYCKNWNFMVYKVCRVIFLIFQEKRSLFLSVIVYPQSKIVCGVAQRSVLGPILLNILC